MTLNYNWTISALDCVKTFDNVDNFVINVHWRYSVSDGTISTDIYGSVGFEKLVDQDGFVPFEELTETIVIGWLESTLDVKAMQSQLNEQLDNIINPKIVQPQLPWIK